MTSDAHQQAEELLRLNRAFRAAPSEAALTALLAGLDRLTASPPSPLATARSPVPLAPTARP